MLKPNFGLVLVFRNEGKILPIVTVSDPGIIRTAARRAVSEAASRARAVRVTDPALSALHTAESHKLREIFNPLIMAGR